MDQKPRFGPFDIGAILAAGAVIGGAYLPFWIYGWGRFAVTQDFLKYDEGFLAILAALTAIVLVFWRVRLGAIAVFAGTGLHILWRMTDTDVFPGSTLGFGAYLMFAGATGGIVLLGIGLVGLRPPAEAPEERATPEARGSFPPPDGEPHGKA